jgi:hypothetical protein
MTIFRAQITTDENARIFEDITADTPRQALDLAAEKYQCNFREIRVPHLSPLQKLAEHLREINRRFEA